MYHRFERRILFTEKAPRFPHGEVRVAHMLMKRHAEGASIVATKRADGLLKKGDPTHAAPGQLNERRRCTER
jgi:hypothetical protein